MSSLYTAMNLRVPNLWVHTNEPFAWMDSFVQLSNQPVFFLDPTTGMVGYNKQTGSWQTVLVPETTNPKTQQKELHPIVELVDAIDFVAEVTGTLMFFAGDELMKGFIGPAAGVHFMWRNKFYNNESPVNLPQFVFLSPTAEMPPHITSFAMYVNGNNAYTRANMADLIANLDAASGEKSIFSEPDQSERVIRAAGGLSEITTLDTVFGSIFSSPTRQLETKDVVDRKAELLRATTSLDYREPNFGLEDVAGLDQAKRMILDAQWVLTNPDEAERYGITPSRRFLLLGIPGTGKSMICEAAAKQLGYGLVQFGVARALNSYIGQSEANMRSMFDQLERLAPIVAWADEIGRDLSGGSSSNYTDGGTTSRVHGEFLTRMQSLDPRVFFFAAANGLDHLSPEMLRAGRWDKMLYVGFPAIAERVAIFKMHLDKLPGEFNYDQLAEMTPCWTGAEIVSMIDDTKNRVVPRERRPIAHADIINVMKISRNRLWLKSRTSVVESYRAALDQYEWASSAQYAEAARIASGVEPNINKISRTVIG